MAGRTSTREGYPGQNDVIGASGLSVAALHKYFVQQPSELGFQFLRRLPSLPPLSCEYV